MRRDRPFAFHAGDRGSIPGQDRPRSFKQVVTAPLPNATQQYQWFSDYMNNIIGMPVSQ